MYQHTLYQVNLAVPALSLAIYTYVLCTYSDQNLLQLLLYMAVDDFYMNIYNVIQYE